MYEEPATSSRAAAAAASLQGRGVGGSGGGGGGGGGGRPVNAARVRALCEWREGEAKRRDESPGAILGDADILMRARVRRGPSLNPKS